MKYQNFRGDFTVIETFARNGEQIPVPEHVIVEYFTKKYAGKVICERNGAVCSNCSISDDGMSLVCSVPLSRTCIGMGLLFHNVIEVTDDGLFPDSSRYSPSPQKVLSDGEEIMIYNGISDNTDEIISEVILATIYSAEVNATNVYLTQEEFDSIATKDPTKNYFIYEET